ncbi:protein IQ-DOMAIN 11 [Rutidosis leptorrhynchoides]|uniref:protein IQ-DOMAIN 11 n=1 Tax=Rutidosis leptorrhynchoides TaxID=125765 RepID=UPI003A998F85
MGKKRCWFGFLKRLFVCKAESTDKNGTKNRRWCFSILKMSRHYHALETPDTKLNHLMAAQKQHTKALAIAITVAADAAVAAANAAAELARLVRSPEYLERKIQNAAAIKIQSFYRAHLASKALKGLRGVVKLQALIRGQIVRRRILNESKNTRKSKVHQICLPTFVQVSNIYTENQDICTPRIDTKKDQIVQDSTSIRSHNRLYQETSIRANQSEKLRLEHKHNTEEQNLPSFRPRILCNSRRHYNLSPDQSDDTTLPNSPNFPAYMATTESFMAKARSLSTPRHRQKLSFFDGYCTHGSSYGMPMLSSSSSFNGSMKGNYRHMHM